MFSDRGHYYRWQKKVLVTDHHRLEAHKLLSQADFSRPLWYIWGWWRGEKRVAAINYLVLPEQRAVRVDYSYQEQPVEPYLIHWTTTTPRYGGQRYWWLCPACGRRCAHLYSGKLFACRQCYDLTYASAQSGDPRSERVEHRLWAIRRRLGAEGGLWNPLPDEKPKHMHWTTYMRLVGEYEKLEVVNWGEIGLLVAANEERSELARLTEDAWADYLRAPTEAPHDLVKRMLAVLRPDGAVLPAAGDGEDEERTAQSAIRRTLGQTAKAAEIPLDFAREVQAEGLLRPDAGRTTRRKRYRPKVASWLTKLYALRQAGYSWDDLRAWSQRRFTEGHEHERRWPAGYASA